MTSPLEQDALEQRYREVCSNSYGCVPYGRSRSRVRVRAPLIQFSSASGCVLTTPTGREYIDFSNAFGSVTLGHGDPVVVAAVAKAVQSGLPAGLGYSAAIQLADRLCADIGGNARAAFFTTGTTGVRAVVEAARQYTGRRLIASAGFHGWDPMWVSANSPFSLSSGDVLDFLYHADALRDFLGSHRRDVAAVVISPDYLHIGAETMRSIVRIAREYDVVIVSDEVKYGYRYSNGPSITRLGLNADIYVYAKCLSNGWPVAAAVGCHPVMDQLSTFVSTLTYSCPAFVAANATLARSDELQIRNSIAAEGGRFLSSLSEVLSSSRLPLDVVGDGHSFQFVSATPELESTLVERALDEGLVFQPGDQQLPSYAFKAKYVDFAIGAMERVVESLKQTYGDLIGAPLTEQAWFDAAWNQMDGLSDRATASPGMREFVQSKFAD